MVTLKDLKRVAKELGLEYGLLKPSKTTLGGIITTVHGMDIEAWLLRMPGKFKVIDANGNSTDAVSYGYIYVKDIDDDWDCAEHRTITSIEDVRKGLSDPSSILDPFYDLPDTFQPMMDEIRKQNGGSAD